MKSPSSILIAIAAGLASALLFAGLVLGSPTAVSLALASPIPIAIASLGWGSQAGFVAALVAAGTIFAIAPTYLSALTYILSVGLPTAWGGHLVGLSRPVTDADGAPIAAHDGTPAFDWYPLGRVLFALAAMAGGACIVLGWLLGYDPDAFRDQFVAAFGQGGEAATSGTSGLSPEELRTFAGSVIALVPYVQPIVLTLSLVVGLYLGAVVTRLSGRMPRPKDDIPAGVLLPSIALLPAFAGLGAALVGGPVGLVGAVVVGAALAAFTLAGLASLHRRTRGRAGRGLILFSSYAGIVLLSFPLVLFAALGAYDCWRQPRLDASAN